MSAVEDESNQDESNTKNNGWRIPEWFPELDVGTEKKLEAFYRELLRFNKKMNLISERIVSEADSVHIADCLIASKKLLEVSERKMIFDLGSGNGLPGIVLAILAPKRKVILVEKDERKVEFLKFVVSRLKLENVQVRRSTIEELNAGTIECAVARGLATMGKTLLLVRKACAKNCEFFHFKSNEWAREFAQVPSQVISMWSPEVVTEYETPGGDKTALSLVLTRKID